MLGLDTQEREEFLIRSDFKAILLMIGQLFIYFICLIGAITDYSLIGNIIASIGTGFAIGQLFIIGHDACHQALAKTPLLNKIIGRICFSFSLHSYSLWNVWHNNFHHNYANIKGLDVIFVPLTKSEYDELNPLNRYLQRLYRHYLGSGTYYILEMWLLKLFLPIHQINRKEWKTHILDVVLLLVAFFIQISIILYLGNILAIEKSTSEVLLLGLILPFLAWNQMMGMVVFIHHTHPEVPWFKKEDIFPFIDRNLCVTKTVDLPGPLGFILYNIAEHTIHHLYSRIPLYHLKKAQTKLEEKLANQIIRYNWSLSKYLEITRICKLYDFDQNYWTDFNGNPTSSPIPKANLSLDNFNKNSTN